MTTRNSFCGVFAALALGAFALAACAPDSKTGPQPTTNAASMPEASSGAQPAEVASASSCADEIPMPEAVVAPADGVPAEYAKYLGRWMGGKWDGKLCTALWVTSMDANGNAEVVFGWGTYDGWRIYKPGFSRTRAHITDDGRLQTESFGFGGGYGAKAGYQLDGEALNGRYEGRSGFYFTNLKKL